MSDWRAKCEAAAPPSKFAGIHALLAELISPAEDEDCTMVLSSPSVSARGAADIAAEIPALVMSGNLVKALECTHRSLAACNGNAPLQGTLGQLRRELEIALGAPARAELVTPEGQIKLLGGSSFLVGRQSASAGTDIAIPCRWLSRGEKSLKLFRRDDAWCVEDLGSTNGHFIGGRRLGVNETVALAPGRSRLEVGRSPDGHAPAWLDLDISDDGAVSISFGMTGGLPEANGVTWVAFPQTASLAVKSGAADILLQDGRLWVAPRDGETISLDGIAFSQQVPLALGCVLGLGTAALPVQGLSAIAVDQSAAAISA
jgi:hypothetical protein